jgi:uncharacterized protein YpmS
MKKKAGIITGIVVGAIIIAGIVLFVLLTSPVSLPPAGQKSFQSEINGPSTGQKTFQSEIIAPPTASENQLIITEDQANTLISQQITQYMPKDLPFNATEVRAYFRNGLVYFIFRGDVSAIQLSTLIALEVIVSNGKARLEVKDIDFGKFPLPSAITAPLKKYLTEKLENVQLTKPSVYVTRVLVREGQIVINTRK